MQSPERSEFIINQSNYSPMLKKQLENCSWTTTKILTNIIDCSQRVVSKADNFNGELKIDNKTVVTMMVIDVSSCVTGKQLCNRHLT